MPLRKAKRFVDQRHAMLVESGADAVVEGWLPVIIISTAKKLPYERHLGGRERLIGAEQRERGREGERGKQARCAVDRARGRV